MITIKFKKLNETTKLPVKGSAGAACYDVYVNNIDTSEGPGKVTYGLGFATKIPLGYKGIIVPRSNLTKTGWVMNNSFGVIDQDYRGELKVVLRQLDVNPDVHIPYEVGERCAQIYFEEVIYVEFKEVDELDITARGAGGFGSSGLI